VSSPAPPDRRWAEDLALARACAAGNDTAWRKLERRHFPYVRAFAQRFGLPEHLAEEVAMQVIGDLWRRETIARYEGRSALRTWLGALVTNAALTARVRMRAREGREQLAGVNPPHRPPAGEDAELEAALGETTTAALGRLDPRARLLVLLHYEQGMTLEEIGRIEGASKATMSRRLHAIRTGLREEIDRGLAARGVTWEEIRPEVDLARLDLSLGELLARTRAAEPPAGAAV
jgi:RNA polymerase sigma-70 factor (ECF subfamily)